MKDYEGEFEIENPRGSATGNGKPGSLHPAGSGAPPTERLHRALDGCVWSPWALFTNHCGVTPPARVEITREEWEWMWAAVTKQQNSDYPTPVA